MSQEASAVLERLLRTNGLGWTLDAFSNPEQDVSDLVELLQQVAELYQNRTGVSLLLTPQALEAEALLNPHKVHAFLQALATSCSTQMLVMVWRILQGLTIRKIELAYHERKDFLLTVTLAGPDDVEDPPYSTYDISDAVLLRHFGITTISGQPLFEGFYPLRLKDGK